MSHLANCFRSSRSGSVVVSPVRLTATTGSGKNYQYGGTIPRGSGDASSPTRLLGTVIAASSYSRLGRSRTELVQASCGLCRFKPLTTHVPIVRFIKSTTELRAALSVSDSSLYRLRKDGVLRPGVHYRAQGYGSVKPQLRWDPEAVESALAQRTKRERLGS